MANSSFEIELDPTSPYAQTELFVKSGRAFFGIWNPPRVVLDGDEPRITIQEGNEGHLDLLADSFYGDRRLWRIIAQANSIDLPLLDVVPGMELIIPKLANVRAALLAASRERREAS